jgi:CBS domain-containing protein
MTDDTLRVADFMVKDVFTVSPETNLMRAVYLLLERGLSGVPVIDEDERVVGFITERDCIRTALHSGYFDEETGLVADFMTPLPITTVSPDDSLIDVGYLFVNSPFRRAPVVADGRLVGMLSRCDVMRALLGGSWFHEPGLTET